MAFPNKDLQVGDFLISDIGEVYLYLGFFDGQPSSFYDRPDYGYLYLFCDSWSTLKTESLSGKIVSDATKSAELYRNQLHPLATELIFKKNLGRLRMGMDGNARYTKSYSKFNARVGHIDIPDRATRFQYVFGLTRIGDKKPRGWNR